MTGVDTDEIVAHCDDRVLIGLARLPEIDQKLLPFYNEKQGVRHVQCFVQC